MALVLALNLNEDFFVDDRQFVVTDLQSPNIVKIRDSETGETFKVTDAAGTEIMPEVLVSSGKPIQATWGSIAIEAPKSILILRGERYRRRSKCCGGV